jgi:hypothetical protein
MNTIKALSFSALLSLSSFGTAYADEQIQVPDLSARLQQQIEHRMQHLLDAELALARLPGSVIIVRAEPQHAAHTPAS